MKFSIITINKNNSLGLLKTILSIISQSYNDYEFIVIDGGSTDESLSIIRNFDKEIDYFVSEPDFGVYNAMNKGILKAKGEYINFMNSGDTFNSKSVLSEVNRQSDCSDIIIGATIVHWPNYSYKSINPTNITFNFFFRGGFYHQSSFINRNLFLKIGLYHEDFFILADWAFLITAFAKYNCTFQSIPLVISNFDATGISNQKSYFSTIQLERKRYLKEEFKFFYDDYVKYQFLRRIMLMDFFKNLKSKILIYIRRVLSKKHVC